MHINTGFPQFCHDCCVNLTSTGEANDCASRCPCPAIPPKVKIPIGLIAGIIAMVVVLLLPLPAELPPAGHRMLAILAFAVVVWITGCLVRSQRHHDPALMAFLLGTAPNVKNPDVLYGTSAAISMALTGFSNSALALVTGALFIAAAMTFTGLDKRIALVTLARVGTSTRRILLGAIAVTIVLSLVVPSATARSAAVVPHHAGRDRRLRRGQALQHRRRHHDHRGPGHQHLERRHSDRRRA